MNWSIIWELVKINILYSNPQSLNSIKKQQKRHPNKTIFPYKSMLRQQLFLLVLFLGIYGLIFSFYDFESFPGYFSMNVLIFVIMSVVTGFIAMYAIFYDSRDVAIYAHLPIRPKELYTAKLLASLGMLLIYLVPCLCIFYVTYAQFYNYILAVPMTLFSFGMLAITSITVALYVNKIIGRFIVRSQHRQLVATIMMSLANIIPILLILVFNMTSGKISDQMADGNLVDLPIIPYTIGFYAVMKNPISLVSLLNFWLPVLLTGLLVRGVVKNIIPHYYDEVLYTKPQPKATKKSQNVEKVSSLRTSLIRHHLTTIQQATLLIQSFIMPLLFLVILFGSFFSYGLSVINLVPHLSDFFGIAFLVGVLLAALSIQPASILGVAISLEKTNLPFLKTLPLNFKQFLLQKFLVLASLQIGLPLLLYVFITLGVVHIPIGLVLAFSLGFIGMGLFLGQLVYRRDYTHLTLNWQDVTQLFNRGQGQFLGFLMMFGSLVLGSFVIGTTIVIGNTIGNHFLVNTSLLTLGVILILLGNFLLYLLFWKNLSPFQD